MFSFRMIRTLLIAQRVTTGANVISSTAGKQHKACFDLNICRGCLFCGDCPTRAGKKFCRFYFTHRDYMSRKRQQAIEQISERARKPVLQKSYGAFSNSGALRR